MAEKEDMKGKPKDQESKGKRSKKKMSLEMQVAVVFGVLFLILLSFFISYKFFKPSNSFEYGPFTVTKARLEGTIVDFYFIPISVAGDEPINLALRNDPREIENISLEVVNFTYSPYSQRRIWLATDPDYEVDAIIARQEIGGFTNALGINTAYAFTEPSGSNPVRNCSDSKGNERVIELRLANSTKVYSEGSCIIVEGSDYDQMIKAADRFVVEWLFKLLEIKLR